MFIIFNSPHCTRQCLGNKQTKIPRTNKITYTHKTKTKPKAEQNKQINKTQTQNTKQKKPPYNPTKTPCFTVASFESSAIVLSKVDDLIGFLWVVLLSFH